MEIKVVENVLMKNKQLAFEVRALLKEKKWSMFNFMSSPGSGKTALLEKLIPALGSLGIRVGVIEGDVTTANDALRLQHLNIPISLINTEKFGGTCHLGSNVILGALETIKHEELDMVIIENVGNLICPSEYDTGSSKNVVLISVTEGEDKPLKYPGMFRKCQIAVINKIDLTEALEADVPLIRKNILQIHPDIDIFETSAKKENGIKILAEFLKKEHLLAISTYV